MTQEEKARHYDEALKEASAVYKDEDKHLKATLERIFPELAESEDEKIRKEIIHYFSDGMEFLSLCSFSREEIIAWLEKQNKPKHSNKIESKFHEGDWIVFNGLTLYIKEVVKGYYRTISKGGITNSYDWNIDNVARLWTIQDARDGDMLCYKNEISLYKHDIKNCTKQKVTFGGFVYYCCYDGKRFITDSLYSLTEQDKMEIHPATEEQCNALMKAMADAGYTFDFEKKELKEIEQKPTDKIEPKFKVKDWITNSIETVQITGYDIDYGYQVDYEGNLQHRDTHIIEKEYHLWTIDDVKCGEVLVCEGCEYLLFESFSNTDGRIKLYGWYNEHTNNFHVNTNVKLRQEAGIFPANKEQCDVFFAKMHEAGYEWDADKKDLKNIKQKSVWNEDRNKELSLSLQIQAYLNTASDELYATGKPLYSEKRLEDIHKCMLMWKKLHDAYFYQKSIWGEEDEQILNAAILHIKNETYNYNGGYSSEEILQWLKSIKDKVQPLPRQEWSEEDKIMYRKLHNLIYVVHDCDCDSRKKKELSDWLDSLKDRFGCKTDCTAKEEDEIIKDAILQIIEDCEKENGWSCVYNNNKEIHFSRITDWLKSLKNNEEK